ncbi:MAG: hypothetical protein AAGC60_24940 [Acidobacteriota bacterium]
MLTEKTFPSLRLCFISLMVLAFGFVGAKSAFGAALACEGTVANVEVTTSSNVVVAHLDGEWGRVAFKLCKLHASFGRVSPDACKSIQSQLFVAMVTGRSVRLVSKENTENPDDLGPPTCADWSDWGPAWPDLYKYLTSFSTMAE